MASHLKPFLVSGFLSFADKRKAVTIMLKDEEWARLSDNAIANHCGVGNQMVGHVRSSHFVNHKVSSAERTISRNGTTYTQDTTNIGKFQSHAFDNADKRRAVRLTVQGIL